MLSNKKLIIFFYFICFTFQNVFAQVISTTIISSPRLVDEDWNLSGGIIRFESGGYVYGSGTIRNGSVDADYNQKIFDEKITINLKPYNEVFSACWFGASPDEGDNTLYFRRAIDACLNRNIPLFIPPIGTYNFSESLSIELRDTDIHPKSMYKQVRIHIFGGSEINGERFTSLNFTGTNNNFALGIQNGKGVEINNLKITGQYQPPESDDIEYYAINTGEFNDVSDRCGDSYTGIVIDPRWTPFSNPLNPMVGEGGSTGIKIHDVIIENFSMAFKISPQNTQNSDILIFENIHIADCKYGFRSGYAQSKGNVVRNLSTSGRIHTLISIGNYNRGQAGFWTFDGGKISGKCIRLFEIRTSHWFSTIIKNFQAENIGTIGEFQSNSFLRPYAAPPILLKSCNFNFHFQEEELTKLVSYGRTLRFKSCSFRDLNNGNPGPGRRLVVQGNISSINYNNCTFGGAIVGDPQVRIIH